MTIKKFNYVSKKLKNQFVNTLYLLCKHNQNSPQLPSLKQMHIRFCIVLFFAIAIINAKYLRSERAEDMFFSSERERDGSIPMLALIKASADNDLETVKRLISKSKTMDMDHYNYYGLCVAASHGHTDMVKLF